MTALQTRPLCVDLDSTLIHTDLLIQSLLLLLKRNPLWLFALPLWLLKGKAHFKQQLAARQARYPSKIPAKSSAMASKGGTRTGLRSVAVSLATTR